MTINLKENERIDDLQRNGYQIIQDPNRFCFGMDAVLLSGFVNAKKGDVTGKDVVLSLMDIAGNKGFKSLTDNELIEEIKELKKSINSSQYTSVFINYLFVLLATQLLYLIV